LLCIMDKNTEMILGMSCIIPCIVGIIKYTKIEKKYIFFIYIMWLDFFVEFSNIILKKVFLIKNTTFGINTYLIINFIFFLILILQNKFIQKKIVFILIALSIIIAVGNNLYNNSFSKFNFFVLCFVSICKLFISIHILSRQIFETYIKPLNNFWFLFSCCAIVYDAFTLLIFGLYFFSLFSTEGGRTVVYIHHFINVFCYLFFAFVILKIPKKVSFYNKLK
jgi:hypothetical protein